MITIRKSADRGHAHHGWLESRHTFSFASYQDPHFTGFHTLRVINEDRVIAGAGFGEHGHQNMEIVSYVIAGALAHRDSIGNGSLLRRGDVQRMSAGTGIRHSEFNGSETEPVHFLQIWITPFEQNLPPSYEERHFKIHEQPGELHLIASPNGQGGSLRIHQDILIYAAYLEAGQSIRYPSDGAAWVQMVSGAIEITAENEVIQLESGDAAAFSEETLLTLRALTPSEWLLFDLGDTPEKL